MNLLRIRYFIEAARCESFTEAAKRLYTSQPNLSKQITLFEEEIGANLFSRSNRCVTLTRAGKYLYDQLKDLPAHTDHAFRQARALSRRSSDHLSVGLLEGQDVNISLLKRFEQLRLNEPDIAYDLDSNGFRNLRCGLESSRYDLIVTLSFDVQERRDISWVPLIRQKGAIAICRSKPNAKKERATMYDFRHEDFICISPEESAGGYQLFLRQCEQNGFHPNIVRQTQSLESLFLCVEAGIGAAMVDRNTRFEKSANVRIYPMPDSESADVVAAWMCDNKDPKIMRMIRCLQSESL